MCKHANARVNMQARVAAHVRARLRGRGGGFAFACERAFARALVGEHALERL